MDGSPGGTGLQGEHSRSDTVRFVDVTAELVAPCDPGDLFHWIEDLHRYPQWLDIVPVAAPAPAHPGDAGPAWSVTLRGRLGPLARSKRLRMVRTVHDVPRRVRFERAERDGREHAPWVLSAEVVNEAIEDGSQAGPSSLLKMHLHYGGTLGGPPVRKLLSDAIGRSRARLLERLSESR